LLSFAYCVAVWGYLANVELRVFSDIGFPRHKKSFLLEEAERKRKRAA